MTFDDAAYIVHGVEPEAAEWEQQQQCEENQQYEESLDALIEQVVEQITEIQSTIHQIKVARAFLCPQ